MRAYGYESSTGCTGPPPSKAPLKNRISAWPLWQVPSGITAIGLPATRCPPWAHSFLWLAIACLTAVVAADERLRPPPPPAGGAAAAERGGGSTMPSPQPPPPPPPSSPPSPTGTGTMPLSSRDMRATRVRDSVVVVVVSACAASLFATLSGMALGRGTAMPLAARKMAPTTGILV
jgi:hypothetical protein